MRADDRRVETKQAGAIIPSDTAPSLDQGVGRWTRSPRRPSREPRAGEDAASPISDSTLLSRRGFHPTVLGAAGGLTFGFGGASHGAAAADVDFALPVPTDERSSQTMGIEQTVITVDPALATNPLHLPVTDIGFNRTYTSWEARNRLDTAMANALIRTHAVTEKYLDGEDYYGLFTLWSEHDVPVEPDWGDYLARLSSDEELVMPIVALPADAPADATNVEWLEVDPRQGVVINYVSSPQIIVGEVDKDLFPGLSWSYRVGLKKELHVDIHVDIARIFEGTVGDQDV